MPLVAVEEGKSKIFAWEVKERAPLYTCKDCGGRLLFMDCRQKIKYFRHYEKSNCESEPETPEHLQGKQKVYETILAMKNCGSVELEYSIDNLKADVYWESTWRKAAIEVQASNYTIDKFEDKIYNYARKDFVIIYLFVGDNFLKQTKPYIYSLKEIEKQIFVTKNLPGLIYAGYLLSSGKVFIPCFQEKWSHGGGECSHRFISMRGLQKTVSLTDFLIDAVFIEPPKVPCKHTKIKHVAHFDKIKRYKVVCEQCNKFIKWLPNKEALQLGYPLN